MKTKELPKNDLLAQYVRSLNDINNQKELEMNKCNHLFVLLEEGKTISGFHSTDYEQEENIVECIHCGLTNKFMKIEEKLPSHYNKTQESIIYSKVYHQDQKPHQSLISNIPLPSYHPELLYKIALLLKPSTNIEDIYNIMSTLHNLETEEEKLRLKTIEESEDLINRYRHFKKNEIKLKIKYKKK